MSRSIADTAICGKPLRGSMGTESFNVSVLLGNGDGTFQAARNFGAGFDPTSVALGDFNGDGVPDLAVANGGSGNVSILINNTPIQ